MTIDEKALNAAVDAYCEAWAESFMAANPYETVQPFTKGLREHIEAGLKAAFAVHLQRDA